jgi:hypothetical protein
MANIDGMDLNQVIDGGSGDTYTAFEQGAQGTDYFSFTPDLSKMWSADILDLNLLVDDEQSTYRQVLSYVLNSVDGTGSGNVLDSSKGLLEGSSTLNATDLVDLSDASNRVAIAYGGDEIGPLQSGTSIVSEFKIDADDLALSGLPTDVTTTLRHAIKLPFTK